MADKFYTKKELAIELRVSVRTIDNWMAQGIIGYSKIGRKVIFSFEDLRELVDLYHQGAARPDELAKNQAYVFSNNNFLNPNTKK